ncbi:MAG: ADP-ribosylglycohydrolase family protein [Candidatus Hydrogenedentota bacterium]|nr:MAG: ADP-ribosylglycohydrolase family protein [Candidatus Hydrogenedentota bacterium]
MSHEELRDRILGCVVGATIGDAIGGAFEFQDADFVRERIGTDWIDDMYPYKNVLPAPHYIWTMDAPAGTGTDDTRYNHIFIETVLRHGKGITSRDLAGALIERYDAREKYYPGAGEMAHRQFADWNGVCCGHLGRECPLHPGVPPEALANTGLRMDFPTLVGMLMLASAGMLHVGDPEQAYRHAYLLDFMDIGYAREAVGLFAALVSVLSGGKELRPAIDEAIRLNPFELGGTFGGPTMIENLPRAKTLARGSKDDRDLVQNLAHAFASRHPLDPVEHVSVAVASLYFTRGDAKRSILIAANHRIIDERGDLVRFRDNDCTAYFAGALAGSHCGLSALPPEWVEKVVDSNRKLYGIDLIGNAEKLCEMVTKSNE